jgi:hypothetical protein
MLSTAEFNVDAEYGILKKKTIVNSTFLSFLFLLFEKKRE